MDSHWIWRIVKDNYESMHKEAPDGHVPLVLVSLPGYSSPLPLGWVQSNVEHGWAMLQLATGEGDVDPTTGYPGDRYVFVRADHVLSIELQYVRVTVPDRAPVGFAYREVSGDELTPETG